MKLTDLLCLDAYWMQGYNTRITADNNNGTTKVMFSVWGKCKGRYTTNMYQGEDEYLAVKAFLENENSDSFILE